MLAVGIFSCSHHFRASCSVAGSCALIDVQLHNLINTHIPKKFADTFSDEESSDDELLNEKVIDKQRIIAMDKA